MKILYALQGTGNGHLARAIELYPELCKYGQVDILISGTQADIQFPFPIKYSFHGLSFIFGKHGGIDQWATISRLKLFRLFKDIKALPVLEYDVIINDFEPISAWACKWRGKKCMALSHQAAVLHPDAPKPIHKDGLGYFILQHYAPTTIQLGFHFQQIGAQIHTPIIRNSIRQLSICDEGYYTVYLPAYDDNTIIKELSQYKGIHWQVFSKHAKESFHFENISIQPIESNAFIQSLAHCHGVLCGAGFETPAEALFLGKKLMVIPMSGQYEQQCNAAFLKKMNIPVIQALSKKYRSRIIDWLDLAEEQSIHYPDNTADIAAKAIQYYTQSIQTQSAIISTY
jgi:uncharacterized protein (TIGR00661 family)